MYGLTDDDFAEIDPSCHEEATSENPNEVVKYVLWDVLQLKASRKANIGFNDIISLTQAAKVYQVSSNLPLTLVLF